MKAFGFILVAFVVAFLWYAYATVEPTYSPAPSAPTPNVCTHAETLSLYQDCAGTQDWGQ